jgi:hypothetical protein
VRVQYRQYGHTGIRVSALGYGTGRFAVARRQFDEELYLALMRRAFQLGVNYVDTGDVYSFGLSEIAVGKAIEGHKGKVHAPTKRWYRGTSGDEAQQRLECSLKRLRECTIDFYHLHDLRWASGSREIRRTPKVRSVSPSSRQPIRTSRPADAASTPR